MLDHQIDGEFQRINRGYDHVFQSNRLSLGFVVPIEAHHNDPVPSLERHIERVQLAEELGFTAVWLRDVPFNVPTFGDAGQTYDPFVYLGYLAAQTEKIALGVASIVLPLRHPAHVAKAAATADTLSGGRLVLGVASGDRPEEYPAMNMSFADRGERFRAAFQYIQRVWEDSPVFDNVHGRVGGGIDILPKPISGRVPMIMTGGSQQAPDWIARNGDGWMTYPRNVDLQARIIGEWRNRMSMAGKPNKPAMQSLYIDLVDDADAPPQPIHLGFRSGSTHLGQYLVSLRDIGVNHVALNLRFNNADVETTMKRIADEIVPVICA